MGFEHTIFCLPCRCISHYAIPAKYTVIDMAHSIGSRIQSHKARSAPGETNWGRVVWRKAPDLNRQGILTRYTSNVVPYQIRIAFLSNLGLYI